LHTTHSQLFSLYMSRSWRNESKSARRIQKSRCSRRFANLCLHAGSVSQPSSKSSLTLY